MTGLEIFLLIAGFTATSLVVAAMILIAPSGGVPVHPEDRDPAASDPIALDPDEEVRARKLDAPVASNGAVVSETGADRLPG